MKEQKSETNRHQSALKAGTLKKIVVLLASLVLVSIAGYAVYKVLLPSQSIDRSSYQVVYLVSGQAYFGRLQNKSGEYLILESPFTVQAAAGDAEKNNSNTTSLLRVRDQVYGPQDSIALKSDHVAFWQNLRKDSKVSKAIAEQLSAQ